MFDKLEAELAKAAMSLPATKGFEFGSGFAGKDVCCNFFKIKIRNIISSVMVVFTFSGIFC